MGQSISVKLAVMASSEETGLSTTDSPEISPDAVVMESGSSTTGNCQITRNKSALVIDF